MNTKFFLTVILSFGCAVMIFMWYSANGAYKESQLSEKQYLFKISSLESENKMELKLIDALRLDISKNEEDLRIKTNLLETLHRKEKGREEEKEQLQKNIDKLKNLSEKLRKQNNEWIDNWKEESQKTSEKNKNKIQTLENELTALKLEHSSLNKQSNQKQINSEAEKTTHIQKTNVKMLKKDEDSHVDVPVKDTDKKDEDSKEKSAVKENETQDETKDQKDDKKVDVNIPKKIENLQPVKTNSQSKSKETENDSGTNKDVIENSLNKNGHQMQARPPVIKNDKSLKVKEDVQKVDGQDQVEQWKGVLAEPKKNVDKADGQGDDSSKNSNKHNVDGQLVKPNVAPINKDTVKLEKENYRLANPKIIKKVDNPQINPPFPQNVLDNVRKVDNDGDQPHANNRDKLMAVESKKNLHRNKAESDKNDMLK